MKNIIETVSKIEGERVSFGEIRDDGFAILKPFCLVVLTIKDSNLFNIVNYDNKEVINQINEKEAIKYIVKQSMKISLQSSII